MNLIFWRLDFGGLEETHRCAIAHPLSPQHRGAFLPNHRHDRQFPLTALDIETYRETVIAEREPNRLKWIFYGLSTL